MSGNFSSSAVNLLGGVVRNVAADLSSARPDDAAVAGSIGSRGSRGSCGRSGSRAAGTSLITLLSLYTYFHIAPR